jgi:hypothetical protein
MDISNNIDLITLECLTNPGFYDKYNLKKNNPNKISKADRKFYKKRIINETKKMLRNDFDTPALKEIFNEYVISLVDYFKIVDKRDILQEDYKNNPPQDKEYYDNVLDEILDISDNNLNNLISPDQLLFKTANETKKITLDNFVVKHNPPKENIIYPEQKEINLKEPSLKTKGLKTKGLKMKALKSTQIKSSVEKENIDKI